MLDVLDQQLASSDGPQGSDQASGDQAGGEKTGEDQANSQGNADQAGKNQEGKPQGGKESDAASANPQGSEQANAGAKTGSEKALASAADQIASQLQSQRMANRNAAKQRSQSTKKPNGESSAEPDDAGRTENQPVGNSSLPNVMLDKGMEWGRLRQQRAEQVIEGKREFLDPEFGDAIRAYYRALGKQGLDKKPSAVP